MASPGPSSKIVTCPVCTRSTHDENNCHNCGARLKTSVVVPGILIRPPPPSFAPATTDAVAVEATTLSVAANSASSGSGNDSNNRNESRFSLSHEPSLSLPRRSSLFRSAPVYPSDELSPSAVSSSSSSSLPTSGSLTSHTPPPPPKTEVSSASSDVSGTRISAPPSSSLNPRLDMSSHTSPFSTTMSSVDHVNQNSDNIERRMSSTTASLYDFHLSEKDGVSFERQRRVNPARTILVGVFCFLILGVLLAFKYSKDSRTDGIIAFIAYMSAAVLVCIFNLRLSFPENVEIRSRAFDHVGFKRCDMCCFHRFSVAKFILFTSLSVLIALLVGCGIMSVFVRHGAYIRNNRWYFLMECIFASVLPAIPLALISWNRGGKSKQLMLEAGLITSKLGGLHVVLEMSGIYARLFDHNTRVSLVLEHHFSDNETVILEHIRTQILHPLREDDAVENFLMYPLLFAIGLTILSILLTLLRRATCRDHKKERSEEKLQNYGELGIRMKSMLVLNVFLCLIVSTVLGFGLRYDRWAVADEWGDWVVGFVMCAVACVILMVGIVAVTTRFGGFIRLSPWSFASEIALVCLLTMSPLAYIAFNRGSNHEEIVFQLLVLTATICGLHVLLELSGTYASIFHAHYRKDNVIHLLLEGEVRRKNSTQQDDVLLINTNRLSRCAQRTTNAHKVLVFVLICLLCGLGAASALPERSTKTLIIVGFVGVIFVVIVVCLCDLQMHYIEPTSQACNSRTKNIGFKECHFLCIKHLSLQWLITTSLVVALGGFLVVAGSIAAYVRYGTYIRDQFWAFLVECLMMSILTAIPVALISWNRGGQSKELLVEVFLITGKFGGLHIFLELSGVYQATFEEKERYSLVSQDWLTKNETDIFALVQSQILTDQKENSGTNEQIFLVFLAIFFSLSAFAVLLAFLRRRCCRDPNKPRSQEKLHAYAALGVRMKAMLVLSIVLCILILPELILGLRSDSEFESNCKKLAAFWSEFALSAILFALVVSVILTSIAAVTTRYGGFILMSPWSFVAELGVVVLLSITPMGYLAYNRGQGHMEIGLEMGILCLKFGGIHLLLELSGYYATALGGRYRDDLVCELPKARKSQSLEDTSAISEIPMSESELNGNASIERM